ncbi:MAG: hypothetical protein ACSI46_25000 [Gloeotrichia echinulata DVL01]|jgi:hypothetical protein
MPNSFLLPPSQDGYGFQVNNRVQWQQEPLTNTFQKIAEKLKVEGDSKTVSSIPDIWARPLLMQMALYDQKHPLHEEMKAQWQGMLAAIALAKVKNLKLTSILVDLENNNFFKEPNKGENSVYQLEAQNNPWHKIYVFLIDDKAVGMTSPSTIVCPSQDGNWGNLGWFDSNKGLSSPLTRSNFLSQDEKEQLYFWLNNLKSQLQSSSKQIVPLIEEFQNKIFPKSPEAAKFLRQDKFEEDIVLGKLTILSNPIQQKTDYDEAQRKVVEVQKLQERTKLEAEIRKLLQERYQLNLDEIFQKELYVIEQSIEYIPGALFPKGFKSITYNSKKITPILPLNIKLLEVLTPEQLQDLMRIEQINEQKIRITIELQLDNLQPYPILQEYEIKDNHILKALPILEIWPNFKVEGWNEYYAFYGDRHWNKPNPKSETFRVKFPKLVDKYDDTDAESFYQISQLTEFPSYIICQNEKKQTELGIILLQNPQQITLKSDNNWTVGVDFGTSFTNVYYNNHQSKDKLNQLKLSNLRFSVTKTVDQENIVIQENIDIMYSYFLSVKDKKLPISSVLKTQKPKPDKSRHILDGFIYIVDNLVEFNPSQENIKTDLKWGKKSINFRSSKMFLSQLALQITAEAVKQQVTSIKWVISYPSVFSENDLREYLYDWNKIFEYLQPQGDTPAPTPIKHDWSSTNEDYRLSESLAAAYYFSELRRRERKPTFICIDMGGGTSDISIWQDNTLVHQCSILLAGKDLFCKFLEQEHRYDILKEFVGSDEFENLSGEQFNAKLNAFLIANGSRWLEKRNELDEAQSQEESLRLLMMIGVSGLYYYIGILLNVLLSEDSRLTRLEIPPIYVGGNGSRIFHWLVFKSNFDSQHPVNKLLSKMLQEGSSISYSQIQNTILSEKPKDEVACGLVLDKENIPLQIPPNLDNSLIAGEACEFRVKKGNGSEETYPFRDNQRLKQPNMGEMTNFQIPDLANIQKFWESFRKIFDAENLHETIEGRIPILEKDFDDFQEQIETKLSTYLENNMQKHVSEIRFEPPFIICLKVLLETLDEYAESLKS